MTLPAGITIEGVFPGNIEYQVQAALSILKEKWPAVGPGNWIQRYFGRFFGMKPEFPSFSKRRPLKITFTDKDIVVYGLSRPLVTGYTVSSYEMIVKVAKDWKRLSETAFTHEMCHVALGRNTGNPDPDHEASYRGDQWTPAITKMVWGTDTRLRAMGY